MLGPVSGCCSKRNGFGLEQRLTQTWFEILASEAPGERRAKGGLASAEGVKGLGQFPEAGVVMVPPQHYSLVGLRRGFARNRFDEDR